MKTRVILFLSLISAILFTACEEDQMRVVPNGKVTSQTFNATGISQLDVQDLFEVHVEFSETEESVIVEADDNLHSLVEIEQRGATLYAGLKDNTQISGHPTLRLLIKTDKLDKVTAAGVVTVDFENLLSANELKLDISGASRLRGAVDVVTLDARIDGASVIELTGKADRFDIDAEGASAMSSYDFETDVLNAQLEGGSDISLTVNQQLNVDASGASKVYYKGNGVIESQHLSDASKIVKVN